MQRDNYKTKVIFRKEKDGSILAVFPYDIADFSGHCTCYAHVGQHSALQWEYMTQTKPAQRDEYKDLFEELESIGYNLHVIQRRNTTKYRNALLNSKN